MIIISIAVFLVAFALLHKRFEFSAEASWPQIAGKLIWTPFGIRLAEITFSIRFSLREAPILQIGKLKPKRLSGRKKRKKPMPKVLRAISFKRISAVITAGVGGSPDKGVIITGALGSAISSAISCLGPAEAEIKLVPELEKNALCLKVEGILVLCPGRLFIEILKSKRRSK